MSRVETIGRARLFFGDALEIMPTLGPVPHIVCDPPYEASMHAAKAHLSNLRKDTGPAAPCLHALDGGKVGGAAFPNRRGPDSFMG